MTIWGSHKSTDPACVQYRPPRGPYTQLMHDWHRGESCPICMPGTQPTDSGTE